MPKVYLVLLHFLQLDIVLILLKNNFDIIESFEKKKSQIFY